MSWQSACRNYESPFADKAMENIPEFRGALELYQRIMESAGNIVANPLSVTVKAINEAFEEYVQPIEIKNVPEDEKEHHIGIECDIDEFNKETETNNESENENENDSNSSTDNT